MRRGEWTVAVFEEDGDFGLASDLGKLDAFDSVGADEQVLSAGE